MQLKIMNGTPKSGKSLCKSCKNAMIIRGQNMEERILCNLSGFSMIWGFGSPVVEFAVAECSKYQEVNSPSLAEMKQIAWEVTARKRGSVGFGDGVTNPDELETVITPPRRPEEVTNAA